MNGLMRLATADLAHYLAQALPSLGEDWWERHVVDRLSFQQQRMVSERGLTSLLQLDFAALLRVMDHNWYELSDSLGLPRDGRTWVRELQGVRNRWAHLSAEEIPAGEVYRDVDTLGRFLAMIRAEPSTLAAVSSAKDAALAMMIGARDGAVGGSEPQATPQTGEVDQRQPEGIAHSLFSVGDLVALRAEPSVRMPVMEVITGGAEWRYRVFRDNAPATYYERQLQAASIGSVGPVTLTTSELQARLTSLHILSPSAANLFSLRCGRVDFEPYQYRPVLKLIRADRPRLLIADEVGVGKTIEAGLVLQELRARTEVQSVLVICPKALVAEGKWVTELRRFDEQFTHLDGRLLRHCLHETHLDGEWPEQYAKAILPFSLFDSDLVFGAAGRGRRRDQGLLALDPPPKFDLVIVDEAHHLRNPETLLHQGVRYFCDHAQAVLLLTATPVQLGSDDLFVLLNVLRPDLIIDRPSFEQMAQPNGYINAAIRCCRAGGPDWTAEARTCLAGVAETEWGRRFVRESPRFQEAYDRLDEPTLSDAERVGLIREIEELYTFSPLINRTRRRDIGEFTVRQPSTVAVEFTPEQRALHDGLLALVETVLARCHGQQNVKFMMTTLRRQAASCLFGLAPSLADLLQGHLSRLELLEASDGEAEVELGFVDQVRTEIQTLLAQARQLPPDDPKVRALVKALLEKSRLPNNKAMVFSTFRHTLAHLEPHVRQAGLRVAVVHGEVPEEERTELRKRFALPPDQVEAIDVLLSSEVGCEGLDFQFCDFLVNYDLPWNPMRIEQRIGRIDRRGQRSQAVAILNLITPGTVDAEIYDRCMLRIGVFHHAVGGSEEILGEITRALHDIAEDFDLSDEEKTERLQQLADNSIRQMQEAERLEQSEAELFGLNLPGRSWRDEVEAAETFWLSALALQGCVTAYLTERLGAEHYLLGERPLKTLRLSQEARNTLLADYRLLPRTNEPAARAWEKWLRGAAPTLALTFDQETAAENPTAAHLSVLHPLVRQAARHLAIGEPVAYAFSVDSSDLPTGRHSFALYRWTKRGAKPDETLVAVGEDPAVEACLMDMLTAAVDKPSLPIPDAAARERLDARHHHLWLEARASHIAANRELVEHRRQSLTVSHAARSRAIEDQIAAATNDRIRLMKEAEWSRAAADFHRRVDELEAAASTADIEAAPVVFGTVEVRQEGVCGE